MERIKQGASGRGTWHCSGYVHGEPAEILIDEGAELTIVNPEIIEQIPYQDRPAVYDSPLIVKGIGKNVLEVSGLVELKICIEGIEVLFPAFIVEDLRNTGIDYLMGNDFTFENDLYMRTSRYSGYFKEHFVPIYKSRWAATRGRMVAGETMTIPAEDTILVPLSLVGHPKVFEMCAERVPCWPYPDILVPALRLDLRRGGARIELRNTGKVPVLLQQGTAIANLTPVVRTTIMEDDRSAAESYVQLLQSCIDEKPNHLTVNTVQTSSECPSPEEVGEFSDELTREDVVALLPEHLQCMLSAADASLTPFQLYQVVLVIMEYGDVFKHPDAPLGRTHVVEHKIDVQQHHPIKQAPRRLAYHKQETVRKELDKMLEQGLIKPSVSPWASPIVLVTKKDGTTRFCIDYRKVNEVTRKDAFPLPRIDESLDSLSGSEYFCTLDLASGYWQVGMAEEDKDKTAFCTRFGLFEWNVMPFGLCNAPATFERLTEHVLRGMQWEEALVYIDDIICFGKTFEQCLMRLRRVFQRILEHHLTFKPKKCDLFKAMVEFLGHIVSASGVSCDPVKIVKVRDWQPPKTVTEVRSFLGMAGYYRMFVPNYATLAKPLTELTKKTQAFIWSARCQKAFDSLKNCLIRAPILAYPDMAKMFILDTDASGYAAGSVISQLQDDGTERPIAYASATFNSAEEKYCTTHRELLAVVKAVEHFHHYLAGKEFLIRVDHASLVWLKNFRDPKDKVARWILRLEDYNYKLQFRKGEEHGNADAMSRMPVPSPEDSGSSKVTRLCKFLPCKDCRPRRSAKEVETLATYLPEEIIAHVRMTQGVLPIPPRRSERLAAKMQDDFIPVPENTGNHRTGQVNIDPPKSRLNTQGSTAVRSPAQVPAALFAKYGQTQNTGRRNVGRPKKNVLEPKVPPRRSPRLSKKSSMEEETRSDLNNLPSEETIVPEEEEQCDPGDDDLLVSNIPLPHSHLVPSDNPEDNRVPDEAEQDDSVQHLDKPPERRSNWLKVRTNADLLAVQMADPSIASVIAWVRNGRRPTKQEIMAYGPVEKALWVQWLQLTLREGVLYRKYQDERYPSVLYQLVVPKILRREIFDSLHTELLSAHLGVAKTLESVRSRFYWPGYRNDVKLWIKRCKRCTEGKSSPQQHPKKALSQRLFGAPFDRVSVDILTLLATNKGNKYVLVVIDGFTKWTEAYALPNHRAETVAKTFVEEWVCRHGVPRDLHSDRGAEFTGELITELCRLLQITKTQTPAYRPQANGQCELMNKTVCRMLASFVREWKEEEWDDILPYVMSAYRRSVHCSTGVTPNQMLYGRECNLPLDLVVGSPHLTPKCPVVYVEKIKDRLQDAHSFARDKLKVSASQQKRAYDRCAGSARRFHPGDNVMYYYPPKKQKLDRPWVHYIVIRAVDSQPYASLYEIAKDKHDRPRQVHIDSLKEYTGWDPIIKWWKDPEPQCHAVGTQTGPEGGGDDIRPVVLQQLATTSVEKVLRFGRPKATKEEEVQDQESCDDSIDQVRLNAPSSEGTEVASVTSVDGDLNEMGATEAKVPVEQSAPSIPVKENVAGNEPYFKPLWVHLPPRRKWNTSRPRLRGDYVTRHLPDEDEGSSQTEEAVEILNPDLPSPPGVEVEVSPDVIREVKCPCSLCMWNFCNGTLRCVYCMKYGYCDEHKFGKELAFCMACQYDGVCSKCRSSRRRSGPAPSYPAEQPELRGGFISEKEFSVLEYPIPRLSASSEFCMDNLVAQLLKRDAFEYDRRKDILKNFSLPLRYTKLLTKK